MGRLAPYKMTTLGNPLLQLEYPGLVTLVFPILLNWNVPSLTSAHIIIENQQQRENQLRLTTPALGFFILTLRSHLIPPKIVWRGRKWQLENPFGMDSVSSDVLFQSLSLSSSASIDHSLS